MRKRYVVAISVVLLLILGVVAITTTPNIFGDIIAPLGAPGKEEKQKQIILKYANEYGIDSCFIAAVIRGESNWKYSARSHVGAQGLMQLMPGTAASIARVFGIRYNASQILDEDINIRLGTALLRYNFDKYKTIDNVLIAYNAGGGRVGLAYQYLPTETKFYLKKIKTYYDLYQRTYPTFCTGRNGQGVPSKPYSNLPDFEAPAETAASINVDINALWKSWLPQ